MPIVFISLFQENVSLPQAVLLQDPLPPDRLEAALPVDQLPVQVPREPLPRTSNLRRSYSTRLSL